MKKHTQISAFIAQETKERLDRYARETGARKAHVVEHALEEYLAARDDVPLEYAVPREIVLGPEAFSRVVELIESPPQPTPALRKVMRGRKA